MTVDTLIIGADADIRKIKLNMIWIAANNKARPSSNWVILLYKKVRIKSFLKM